MMRHALYRTLIHGWCGRSQEPEQKSGSNDQQRRDFLKHGYCRFGGRRGRNCSKAQPRRRFVLFMARGMAAVLEQVADRCVPPAPGVHATANRLGERSICCRKTHAWILSPRIFNVIEPKNCQRHPRRHSFGGLSISGIADAMPGQD